MPAPPCCTKYKRKFPACNFALLFSSPSKSPLVQQIAIEASNGDHSPFTGRASHHHHASGESPRTIFSFLEKNAERRRHKSTNAADLRPPPLSGLTSCLPRPAATSSGSCPLLLRFPNWAHSPGEKDHLWAMIRARAFFLGVCDRLGGGWWGAPFDGGIGRDGGLVP